MMKTLSASKRKKTEAHKLEMQARKGRRNLRYTNACVRAEYEAKVKEELEKLEKEGAISHLQSTALEEGLKDAAAGNLQDLGSFEKYADEEIE